MGNLQKVFPSEEKIDYSSPLRPDVLATMDSF